MDAITAAVALLSDQVAVQKMDFAAKMVRNAEESQQGLVEMVMASADAGTLYSSSGGAESPPVGSALNTTA